MANHTPDSHACHEYRQLSRRSFMARTTASMIAMATPAWLPRVTFAQSENSSRDVMVSLFLRGGADGLTLVAPFGDPAYYALRPTIAIPQPDSSNANRGVNLDGFFCLPNAMASLLPAFQAGHLLVVHATGSTDPTRSHFDAQNYMEVGVPGTDDRSTGWLGRHLASRPAMRADAPLRAVGFSYGMPLTLAGAPGALPIPDPGNFGLSGSSSTKTARLNWLANAYSDEGDPLKTAALNTQRTIAALTGLNIAGYVPAGGVVYPTGTFAAALRSTAALIRADMGVEAVQIDISGWDTHSAQGPLTGGMANNMRTFATALAAFHQDLEGAGRLDQVTLAAISEFGRVARENGSQGTDHGHGNCLFVMGGNTNGGRVLSLWPGLGAGQLYESQDLAITIDHRDILAEIVARRLDNANVDVVFPGYTPIFRGAVR